MSKTFTTRTLTTVIDEALTLVRPIWANYEKVEQAVQKRVLQAFQKARVTSYDLYGSTGYGYGDPGREAAEKVFAHAFQAESALVRPQIASGTHALWICLDGLLGPKDQLISVAGPPYDTLRHGIVGSSRQSLASKGVVYIESPTPTDGKIDLNWVANTLKKHPPTKDGRRVLYVQKSKGYVWRRAIQNSSIGELAMWRDRYAPDAIIFVDHCYGEFVEQNEPCAYGADLVAGSLIKNPGGTLAPCGGYIVGRTDLIESISDRVTAPGLGRHVGPTLGTSRSVMQGLFVAPHFVCEVLCGLTLVAAAFNQLGFSTLPRFDEPRSDAVQAIALEEGDLLRTFCKAVQQSSPIDSTAVPEPSEVPGYDDPVVMAAGAFVQGSSSELSADGPLRPPFAAFMQGGTSRAHLQIALERILTDMGLAT